MSQAIQTEVVKLIADSALHPGDALPTETQLSEQLKVSRNSVREAVKALEAMNVVEARVGAGLFVGRFSLQSLFDTAPLFLVRGLGDLKDAIVFRAYLESGMAETVVDHVTQEQLTHLRSILKRWEVDAAKGSIAAPADRMFHQSLTSLAGNALVSKTLDAFWQVRHLAEHRGELPVANPMQNYARHRRIADALEARDPDMLRRSIVRHYREVLEEIASAQVQLSKPKRGRGPAKS